MKMQILGWIAVLAFTGAAYAQQGADGGAASRSPTPTGGLVTLYADDPLGQSLCFYDGRGGSIIQEGEIRNRCSHLNYNSYSADSFAVGVQGGERGVILDK